MNHTPLVPLKGIVNERIARFAHQPPIPFRANTASKAYGCRYIVLGASKLAPRSARAAHSEARTLNVAEGECRGY